ncbi:ImuA family protein [Sphingobacterium griseoflavum]|uniref:Error-prone repair protein ImuA n=1 Tax=Sphingobacterium griseoflavum TaxID=1474952 RepID=A0ABQ3HY05_9SPHI|nr:Error-prone repair protein ImuA [Sphingobacterium griseoflavum]GHE42730.1 hypothetical protein GCM10017764_27720 [Sphingobacterium griseoflavum]
MPETTDKQKTIQDLQRQILAWQGYKETGQPSLSLGLGDLEKVFPGKVFPRGAMHEFMTFCPEDKAASTGFIASLLSKLMRKGGTALWISGSPELFPPSLQTFGLEPDRMVFVCIKKEKDRLWALEEALKCDALCVVVAEINDVDFVQSRRLQLVVEESKVTGLLLRTAPRVQMTTACTVRWHIRALPSVTEGGLPGVGFPAWDVMLLKVRNGNPSHWQIAWQNNAFVLQQQKHSDIPGSKIVNRKVG